LGPPNSDVRGRYVCGHDRGLNEIDQLLDAFAFSPEKSCPDFGATR